MSLRFNEWRQVVRRTFAGSIDLIVVGRRIEHITQLLVRRLIQVRPNQLESLPRRFGSRRRLRGGDQRVDNERSIALRNSREQGLKRWFFRVNASGLDVIEEALRNAAFDSKWDKRDVPEGSYS